MTTCPIAPHEGRGTLAGVIWVYCVGWAALLGATGGVVAIIPLFLAGSSDVRTSLTVAGIAALVGWAFGLAVGMVVGLTMALLVAAGHDRLGPRAVATLMPLVAMVITQSLTFAVFHAAPPPALVAVAALDAVFTLLGAHQIARRYRLLAGVPPRVH